jgi:hypothetical protein
MDFINVSEDGKYLQNSTTKEKYTPFGCNYFDALTGWAPQIWQQFDTERTVTNFKQMKELGVNTIRVFLTIASFMTETGELSNYGLERSDKLIDIAAKNDIIVEFEGPCNWEENPEWAQKYFKEDWNAYFIGEEWLKRLEQFWYLFAEHYKSETAVFSYDLLNEPWLKYDSPLIRKIWGGVPPDEKDINSERYEEFQKLRGHLTREWTSRCTGAIRSADKNHMVTIGFHQESLPEDPSCNYAEPGFSAKLLTDLLDYVGVHWYPYREDKHVRPYKSVEELKFNIDLVRKSLQNAYVGKPYVLEEFGWYGGGEVMSWGKPFPSITEEMQAEWCKLLIESTRDLACGWLTWGYTDVPASMDITRRSGLVDENRRVKKWGEVFKALKSQI